MIEQSTAYSSSPSCLFLLVICSVTVCFAGGPEQGSHAADGPDAEYVRELLDAGEHQEAETAARSLVTRIEAVAGPASLQAAEVIDLLVEALRAAGKSDESETRELAERAVRVKERLLPEDALSLAASLENLGRLYKDRRELDQARPLFERALAIREKILGPEHADLARLVIQLAEVKASTADYAESLPLYHRALAIRESALGPEHVKVAYTLNDMASVYHVTSRYATAKELYERALGIKEKRLGLAHASVARTLNNLANLARDMGDYAAARKLHEKALAIRQELFGPEHPDVARSLNNLGVVLTDLGDVAAARSAYEKALAIREKTLGPEAPEVASSLNNLAALYLAAGDLTRTKPLLERALAIREKAHGPQHVNVTTVLSKLASVAKDLGDYEEARRLYEQALAIRQRALGPESLPVAGSLDDIGNLLIETGDYEAARSYFQRSADVVRKWLPQDHAGVAESRYWLGLSGWLAGDLDGALRQAVDGAAILRNVFQRTARHLAEREALEFQQEQTSNRDLACSILVSVPPGSALPAGSAALAWDSVLRSRAMVLDELATRHRIVAEADTPEIAERRKGLESARLSFTHLLVRELDTRRPEHYRERLDTARTAMERAERALAEASVAFRQEQARRRIGLDEVAQALPRGSALVAYVQYNDLGKAPSIAAGGMPPEAASLLAFVMTAEDRRPLAVPLGSAPAIDALVRRWTEEVSTVPRDRSSGARYRDVGARLRRAVWDPVAKHVSEAATVFVVPDGALHLVSLATLPTGDDRYLVETGPGLHYLSAEKDLVRDSGHRRASGGLLALGGPDFDARPDPPALEPARVAAAGAPVAYRGPTSECEDFRALRFRPLPSSEAEVDELEKLWQRQETASRVLKLTGGRATEATFKHNAAEHRVVHLATHGFVVRDRCELRAEKTHLGAGNPLLLAGLALAGANRRYEARVDAETEDGILTAEEIAALDLRGVEWAVLSACGTGLGPIRTGEGVLGLRRSFEVAGAGTLILSLWAIGDHEARAWIRQLYEARLAGLSTAAAMRQASLRRLEAHRQAGVVTHPFSWGAFVATGDWR